MSPRSKSPLTEAERKDRQEAADYHFEEMEAEYGPLSRDPDFDERFHPFG